MPKSRTLRGLRAIADYLGMAPQTARRLIEEGLPASQIGNRWTTTTHWIDMWILARHERDVQAARERRELRSLRRAAQQRLAEEMQTDE